MSDYKAAAEMIELQAAELRNRDEALARVVRERDAAIRQVEEQRHPCPCGKDTASIKWARCYSCRQAYHAEMERAMAERDSAIRERDEARDLSLRCLYRTDHPTKPGAITACCVLNAGHDEPHKFIEVVEERADRAEALLAEARTEHRDISERYIAASSARIRAEALLRECLYPLADRGYPAKALLAKIREFLAHK